MHAAAASIVFASARIVPDALAQLLHIYSWHKYCRGNRLLRFGKFG